MFPDRYFAARYFANRYFPIGVGVIPPAPVTPSRGSGMMRRYTPIIPHDNRQRAAILAVLDD